MAIRLIDQYPNRAGSPNADYPHGVPRNRSAPGAVDGTPFEQAWFRDQEGFFQGLIETAGITPSGNPDTVENSDYLNALAQAMHGVTEVNVGGDQDVTLGIYPSRVAALRLTGVLGADVDLIVPNTERLYTIIDETTGGFSVTVRTETGTGVTIGESVSVVRSNGTDVVSANPSPDVGQNIAVFDTAGVTEWTVPDVLREGLLKAHVTVIGGGGGGGRRNDTGGGGGGGGGYSLGIIDLSGESSVSITVGGGGAGRSTNGNGIPGESSSFGSFMTATGGNGGGSQSTGAIGGSSGDGSGGDINYGLGDGKRAVQFLDAPSYSGGDGGGFGGGSGREQDADPPKSPGSGGGGTTEGASSAGADGIVIVRW